jgi:hypothetical protein
MFPQKVEHCLALAGLPCSFSLRWTTNLHPPLLFGSLSIESTDDSAKSCFPAKVVVLLVSANVVCVQGCTRHAALCTCSHVIRHAPDPDPSPVRVLQSAGTRQRHSVRTQTNAITSDFASMISYPNIYRNWPPPSGGGSYPHPTSCRSQDTLQTSARMSAIQSRFCEQRPRRLEH